MDVRFLYTTEEGGHVTYIVKIASPDTAFFIKVVPEEAIFDL